MLKKLFTLSAIIATVVAMSSNVEAGKCCKTKRSRKCCHKSHTTCQAPCGVCNVTATVVAPVAEPAKEAAPEPPAEKK